VLGKYITFTSIGEAADLGSQMQQYASLYAIAKHTGKKIIFPESCLNRGFGFKLHTVYNIEFDIRPDSFFQDFVTIQPTDGLMPDPKVYSLKSEVNYNFTNLLHTYHYWYPDDQQDILEMPWNKDNFDLAINKRKELPLDKKLVSIHVRRGDYLKHDHFCKLDVGYYSSAIAKFLPSVEEYHFVVFSNDIEWCKDNLIEESDLITFLEPGTDAVDMMLMSLCDHNVIANSSFSWWAAFRNKNKNKKVTCPKNYIRSYSPYKFLNGNYCLPVWDAIENDAT